LFRELYQVVFSRSGQATEKLPSMDWRRFFIWVRRYQQRAAHKWLVSTRSDKRVLTLSLDPDATLFKTQADKKVWAKPESFEAYLKSFVAVST
jgi:hypothetical protein